MKKDDNANSTRVGRVGNGKRVRQGGEMTVSVLKGHRAGSQRVISPVREHQRDMSSGFQNPGEREQVNVHVLVCDYKCAGR